MLSISNTDLFLLTLDILVDKLLELPIFELIRPLCTLLTAPEELPLALISWSNLLLLELTPLLTVDTFEFIVDKVCVVLFILFSISFNFVLLLLTPPR